MGKVNNWQLSTGGVSANVMRHLTGLLLLLKVVFFVLHVGKKTTQSAEYILAKYVSTKQSNSR